MADNVNITEGSGKTIAGDDIAGIIYQRIKLTLGADGVNDGDVSSSNKLPVNDSTKLTESDFDSKIGEVQTTPTAFTVLSRLKAINDTLGSGVAVSATNLDIRDLTHVTDSVRIGDGTDLATVRTLGSAGALDVSIVDGSGNQITSFGGGTQFAEDAALGATPTGTLGMARRDDSLSTLTPVEDDAVSLRTNSRGALWTKHDGTLTVDAIDLDIRNLVFATDKVDASGTLLGSNSGVDIGDVTINNAGGGAAVNIQDGGNSITVDGSVSVSGSVDTELPAAAALTDNFANPTAPAVGAFNMGWDGTAWDRIRADGGAIFIQDGGNSITVDGTVGVSGTVAVTQSGGWSVGLLAGTNNIGDVDVLTLPAVTQGTSPWVIGDGGGSITVDGSISVTGAVDTELPAAAALTDNFANPTAPAVGAFNMGWDGTTWDRIRADGGSLFIQDGGNSITVDGSVSLAAAIPAGTNNIGDVDVLSLPALPAGTNNIGDVDVLTLPSIPAGSNKIGSIDLDSDATPASAVPATAQYVAGTDGTNARGLKTDAAGELQIDVLTLPALPAGTNNIGDVDVLTLPSIPTGSNTIGSISNISGTISLPTGASTSANQSTEITALQLIDDIVHAAAATLSKAAAIGGVFDDTSPGAATEGAVDAVRINKVRSLGVGPIQIQTADLSNINTTYNNTTTTANSADIDCDGYAHFSLSFSLTSASTPTDIQFIVQFKDADGVYCAFQNSFWGRLKIEDTEVATQKDYVWSSRDSGGIPPGFKTMRVRVVATGTDATKTFTVADAKVGLSTV